MPHIMPEAWQKLELPGLHKAYRCLKNGVNHPFSAYPSASLRLNSPQPHWPAPSVQ